MSKRKESLFLLVFLAIMVLALAGVSTVRKETVLEIQEHNEQLKLQYEGLQREKEILEEILLRDKKKIQDLEKEIEELRIIRARVTAYAPSDNKSGICSDGDTATTATGTIPRLGVAAADPSKLPYGTEIFIANYGLARIEDTGGALRRGKGLRLDVVLSSYEEAMAWGVQEMDVVIQKRRAM